MIDKNADVYTYNNLIVTPLRDQDLLAYAYLRLKKEKVLDLLFYEEVPDLCRFLSLYLREGSITFGCYLRMHTDADTQLVGLGKLEPARMIGGGLSRTEQSLVFFREYMKRSITVPVAHLLCEWIFDRLDVEVMHGYTPVQNRAMVAFSRSAGFTLSLLPCFTTWQGELTDVWISTMDRRRWRILNVFGTATAPPI